MSVARWLETDTFTDKDISSAVAIGAYTADADRMIVCDVSLGSIAGNGDYVIYLTRQINGAGSAYVMLPKTTCAAASGETAIAMQSGMISVRSGDVLTVYVDGLAGDTATPDTVVRFFEVAALQPTTAGRSLTVAATGEASANVTYWSGDAVAGAPALEATAQAILEDTGTTLPALLTSTLASFVNTYSTDATTAGSITRRRGDSWAIVPAALGVLTGYTSLWLTIKRSHDDADSASVLHVKKNASGLLDGLLYLNGAASTSNLASITVTDALTGVISIAVDEAATKELAPGEYYYDVQALIGGNVSTPDSGTFTVTADVTRSVA